MVYQYARNDHVSNNFIPVKISMNNDSQKLYRKNKSRSSQASTINDLFHLAPYSLSTGLDLPASVYYVQLISSSSQFHFNFYIKPNPSAKQLSSKDMVESVLHT